MARQYTENQLKFLEVLFDEANGDVATAKKLAGYAEGSSTTNIVKSLKEEILEATQQYMARNAPRAAVAMAGALLDPTELGIRDKMSAAKELLDRTGLVKTEKMQVEATGGVMLMPPKAKAEEDDQMGVPAIVPIAAAALTPAIIALKNVIGQAKDQLEDATAATERKKLQKLIDSRQNELDRILERKQSDEPITSKDLRKYDFLNKVIKSRKKDKMYNGGMASNKKHMYATSGKVVDRRKK